MQEPTVREFFNRNGNLPRGSGFLARFLISYPESTQGSRQFTEAPEHWSNLEVFNEKITSILNRKVPLREDGTLSPQVLRFNSEAKAYWIEFYNHIESELARGGELYDVRDVASKTADNAARLAGLFQFFEHPESESIGLEALEGGSRIAAWHLNEARRFCGELAMPPRWVPRGGWINGSLTTADGEHWGRYPPEIRNGWGPYAPKKSLKAPWPTSAT